MSTEDKFMRVQQDVLAEIKRQDFKWGADNHPVIWMSILTEEVGEAAQAVNDSGFSETGSDHWRAEMIQVAAVAMQAVRYFDRHNNIIEP